eukprot:scaffold3117_cov70-Phaeocystis_antarctica.AAC.2
MPNLMIRGASARLGPPVDHPHHLRGPIPAVHAIGVRRRDLAGRVPRPCASAYASNQPAHSPEDQCRQHTP